MMNSMSLQILCISAQRHQFFARVLFRQDSLVSRADVVAQIVVKYLRRAKEDALVHPLLLALIFALGRELNKVVLKIHNGKNHQFVHKLKITNTCAHDVSTFAHSIAVNTYHGIQGFGEFPTLFADFMGKFWVLEGQDSTVSNHFCNFQLKKRGFAGIRTIINRKKKQMCEYFPMFGSTNMFPLLMLRGHFEAPGVLTFTHLRQDFFPFFYI